MKKQELTSSFLSHIQWENGILEVFFAKGKSFRYIAEEKIFDEMASAESAGSYYSKNIKGILTLEAKDNGDDPFGAMGAFESIVL